MTRGSAGWMMQLSSRKSPWTTAAPESGGHASGSQAMRRSISAMRLCLGRSVLLAPAPDLAGHIALRLAEVGKSGSREVEPMKPVRGVVHGVEERAARSAPEMPGAQRLPEDAAFGMLHHIEGRSDDSVIRTKMKRPRHRKPGAAPARPSPGTRARWHGRRAAACRRACAAARSAAAGCRERRSGSTDRP